MNSSNTSDSVTDCSATGSTETGSVEPATASASSKFIIIVSKGNHTKLTFYDGDEVTNLSDEKKAPWIHPNQRHPPKRPDDDPWCVEVRTYIESLPKGSSLVSFEYTFKGIEKVLGVSLGEFVKISLKDFFCQKMNYQRTSDEKLPRGMMAEMLGINPFDFEKKYPSATSEESAKLYYAIYEKLLTIKKIS